MILTSQLSPQTATDLEMICRQAFGILVDMHPKAVEPGAPASLDAVTAMVCYDGGNSGFLVLESSPSLAFQFTSRFMGIARPESVDEDVSDAMGELANTIGGNFKGLLSAEVALSTPTIYSKNPLNIQTRGPLCQITLLFETGRCSVTLAGGATPLYRP